MRPCMTHNNAEHIPQINIRYEINIEWSSSSSLCVVRRPRRRRCRWWQQQRQQTIQRFVLFVLLPFDAQAFYGRRTLFCVHFFHLPLFHSVFGHDRHSPTIFRLFCPKHITVLHGKIENKKQRRVHFHPFRKICFHRFGTDTRMASHNGRPKTKWKEK